MPPTPMNRRLVILTTSLDFGGAETQLVRIATRLRQRGWEVLVVSMRLPRAFEAELAEAGIAVETLAIQRSVTLPLAFLKMCGIVRRVRPAVVLSFMVHANILARLSRLFSPMPRLICSARSVTEQSSRGGTRWRDLAYRLTDRLCDLTVQNSDAGRRRYVSVGATPERKIMVIPNGLDLSRFHPDADARAAVRASLGVSDDLFVWLAVGRLEEEKDYPLMLAAFAQATQQRPGHLVVVGKGSQLGKLEQLASELGIAAAVTFFGVSKEVPRLMAAADALVLSSLWEGLPNVLIEAAATALPAVTTDVGGSAEVVLHGETGMVVQGRSPEQLAQAMRYLMELEPAQLKAFGTRAREYAEHAYALDAVVDRWEAVLDPAAKGHTAEIPLMG
jgi:glycosyltransferase involved in cell wall biosynthesis